MLVHPHKRILYKSFSGTHVAAIRPHQVIYRELKTWHALPKGVVRANMTNLCKTGSLFVRQAAVEKLVLILSHVYEWEHCAPQKYGNGCTMVGFRLVYRF